LQSKKLGNRPHLQLGSSRNSMTVNGFSTCNTVRFTVSKYLLMKHDRRQEILAAAMELFAKKGFRGTTTRDLATEADVNEAIIFRHFNTKEELYSAILEHKAGENRDARHEELERLAASTT